GDTPQSESLDAIAAQSAPDAEIELEPQPAPDEIESRGIFEPPIERLDDREQAPAHDAGLQSVPASVEQDAPAQRQEGDDERWAALAEQISMQVLQRIDLFTDTGLREQLSTHL